MPGWAGGPAHSLQIAAIIGYVEVSYGDGLWAAPHPQGSPNSSANLRMWRTVSSGCVSMK